MNRGLTTYKRERRPGPRRHLFLGVFLCWCSSVFAFDLEAYLWQNRLLLIATASPDDPEVVSVRDTLVQRSDALIDRDMVVIQLYETGAGVVGEKPITSQESQRIRAYYGLAPGDKVLVLVGKDGEIKRRSPLTVDLSAVFEQVDAMPMRRQEIRRKAASDQPVTPAHE